MRKVGMPRTRWGSVRFLRIWIWMGRLSFWMGVKHVRLRCHDRLITTGLLSWIGMVYYSERDVAADSIDSDFPVRGCTAN